MAVRIRVWIALTIAMGGVGSLASSGPVRALGISALPDGRGWEMVSPLEKGNSDIAGNRGLSGGGGIQASADGEAVVYSSTGAFGDPMGAPFGSQYLAHRDDATGRWTSENLIASQISKNYPLGGSGTPYKIFSSDLSLGLLYSGQIQFETGGAELEDAPLSPEAPAGYENFYLRDSSSTSFTPLITAAPSMSKYEFWPFLTDATNDLNHVVIGTTSRPDNLVEDLYEWNKGSKSLAPIDVLPGSEQVAHAGPQGGLVGGNIGRNTERAVSDDGSHVFWTYQREILFARVDGSETVQVDASANPSELGGEGQFWTASNDGARVFFTDKRRLTTDSTALNGEHGEERKEDLYERNLSTGTLSDLSTQDPTGAWVQGVVGSSQDGSRVYFVAKGVLSGVNNEGRAPVAEDENLYEEISGTVIPRFITTLDHEDESPSFGSEDLYAAHDWGPFSIERTVRISEDGKRLVFMSAASPTSYDNTDAVTGVPDEEVYLYDESTAALTCVSCNPTGAQPTGASSILHGSTFTPLEGIYSPRVLSRDADRLFFDSMDSLVPTDTNGQEDTYEWENGHVYLLSAGTGNGASGFVDASLNGNDAFFVTRDRLSPADTDGLEDLYDARVGGITATINATTPCTGENCKLSLTTPPVFNTPASTVFSGAGNIPSLPKAPAKPKAKKKKKTPKPKSKHPKKNTAGHKK